MLQQVSNGKHKIIKPKKCVGEYITCEECFPIQASETNIFKRTY